MPLVILCRSDLYVDHIIAQSEASLQDTKAILDTYHVESTTFLPNLLLFLCFLLFFSPNYNVDLFYLFLLIPTFLFPHNQRL